VLQVRFAALIQLLSAIASIVAIVLNTLLLADNINTLLQPLGGLYLHLSFQTI
jgi:hypothetical protein